MNQTHVCVLLLNTVGGVIRRMKMSFIHSSTLTHFASAMCVGATINFAYISTAFALDECDAEVTSLYQSDIEQRSYTPTGMLDISELTVEEILANECLNFSESGEQSNSAICPPANEIVHFPGDNSNVVGFFFDGTGNNHFERPSQDNPTRTAISYLYEAYSVPDNAKYYVVGVGTSTPGDADLLISNEAYQFPRQRSWFERVMDLENFSNAEYLANMVLGNISGLGIRERQEAALEKMAFEYQRGKRVVDIFGFSRGAASARSFQNEILSRYSDVTVRFLGLFDTVSQIGAPSINNEVSWLAGYDLSIEDRTQFTAHAIAKHEARIGFPLTSVQEGISSGRRTPQQIQALSADDAHGRWQEKAFDGVHSDIGYGYESGNRCSVYWVMGEALRTGLEFQQTYALEMMRHADQWHDSMEGVFAPERWLSDFRNSRDALGDSFLIERLAAELATGQWEGTRHVFPTP